MFCEIFFRATPGGNYLIAAGKRLIITGGNTPVEELKQIAAGYPVVTALLTHEHRNHAATLMEFCRESGIPLCVPAPCRGILMRRGVLPKETISFDREPFSIAGLNLRPFPVCHDSAFCCGFFLSGVDGCIGCRMENFWRISSLQNGGAAPRSLSSANMKRRNSPRSSPAGLGCCSASWPLPAERGICGNICRSFSESISGA